MSNVDQCGIVPLPQIRDQRGNLTFIEAGRHIQFEIKRAYYLYDMPEGAMRGGHAHRALHQLMIAIAGSFDVVLDDGVSKKRVRLSRPDCGLYIRPMIWRELSDFSSGSVCMVLASDFYDESDYFREYQQFLAALSV